MSHHTLSSTAKRIYWLGRYLERTENTARLVSVHANLLMDLPKRMPLGWRPMVDITGSRTLFDSLYDDTNENNVARFLINDIRHPGSLLNSLKWARENARTLRGIIPNQAFEYINELHLFGREHLGEPLSRTRRVAGLSDVTEFVQRIEGFMSANLLHDAHWNFLRMGNFIERADMTSRIIDVGTDNLLESAVELAPFADIQWRSVLLSLNAVQSYNISVQEPIQQGAVLEFLFRDPRLPRSLLYSLNSLRNSLRALPRHEKALRSVNRMRRHLQHAELHLLGGETLHTFTDTCQKELAEVHDVINRSYFEFRPRRRPQRKSARGVIKSRGGIKNRSERLNAKER